MIVGNKHNQPKARPKDNEKKTKTDKIYTPPRKKEKKKKQLQHNLVLQITIRNQYTINTPPTT